MEASNRRRWLLAVALLAGCATSRSAQGPANGAYDGPVFDVHAHIEPAGATGHINPHTPATVKALLAEMKAARVDQAAAIVVPDQGAQQVETANVELTSAIPATSGRLVPVASVPSDDTEVALAELDRVAKAGVRAVKVTPRSDPADKERLTAIVQRAEALNLVVLFDGWTLDMDELAKLALAEPKAKLIVAHLGGVRFSDALVFDVIRRYPFYARNVWFDLSTVAHLYARSPYAAQLTWVCRQLGTDRILFGSDFPLVSLSDAVEDVRALGFTEKEQRQILHDNAAALLGAPAEKAAAGATSARN